MCDIIVEVSSIPNGGAAFLDIIQMPEQNNKLSQSTKPIASLCVILIIYKILSQYLGYAYYYVCFWILSGNFSFRWSAVQDFFQDKVELLRSTTFSMIANISISAVSLLITLTVAQLCFRMSVWSYMKPSKRSGAAALKWTSPSFVFNMLSSTAIAFFTSLLNSFGVDVPTSDFSIREPSTLAVILQFLYIMILAPLIEEMIYRGFILKTISPYSKTAAVLVSAISFGLMHGNIPQAASAFCTGLLYAIIAIKSGSIFPSLIIHSLNNLIVNGPELVKALGLPYNSTVYSTIEICIGLFGFFVWFVDYKYMLHFDEAPKGPEKSTAIKKVLTNPLMIVYFGILVFYLMKELIYANS